MSEASLASDYRVRFSELKPPPIRRAHALTAIIDSVKNKNDAKAVLESFVLVGTFLGALITSIIAIYRVSTSVDFRKIYTEHPISGNILLISMVIIFVIISIILFKLFRLRLQLLKFDDNENFHIIQFIWGVIVDSRNKITYSHRIFVSAKKGGLRTYVVSYNWSGHSIDEPEVKTKNPSFKCELRRQAGRFNRVMVFDLGRELNKNEDEIIEWDFITDTTDSTEALPHLGLTIASPKFPKFNTFLAVSFKKNLGIASLRRETYFSALPRKALASKVVEADEEGNHLWPLRPRLGFRYCLNWVYEG